VGIKCPVLLELEAIKQHSIKTHTILIDDCRFFGTEGFDYITIDQVIKSLLEINPSYQFKYENGYTADDILVAYI
ncbi:MAG TPA: hypothetical protein PLD02_16495, partial [Saprospiraceae bacterium]|nr:hypothetical protein [Saprospiraceae bacterium]